MPPRSASKTSSPARPSGSTSDLLLEAKAKDLALRHLRDQLGERDWRWEEGRLLAP